MIKALLLGTVLALGGCGALLEPQPPATMEEVAVRSYADALATYNATLAIVVQLREVAQINDEEYWQFERLRTRYATLLTRVHRAFEQGDVHTVHDLLGQVHSILGEMQGFTRRPI